MEIHKLLLPIAANINNRQIKGVMQDLKITALDPYYLLSSYQIAVRQF